MALSDVYKRLVNGFRTANGLAPLYPAPGAETPPAAPNPPLAQPEQHRDVTDRDGDGATNEELADAVQFVRDAYDEASGDADDEGDDDGGDGEADELDALGALALPVRRLLTAHYKAKFEGADAEQEKAPAEAKRVADTAAFIRACASTKVIKR